MALSERDYLIEERAAIAELDGGLSKEEAMALALREVDRTLIGGLLGASNASGPGLARGRDEAVDRDGVKSA